MEKILKLTKIDVVKKHLETAIRLYFDYSDPISIHSLTCAAHGILSDLNKKDKRGPMIVSDILIADKYKKEWNYRLRRPQNFFKHADRDSIESIDFDPEITQYFIFDAVLKYHELAGEIPNYFAIFKSWFMAKNLEIFIMSEKDKALTRKIASTYGENRKRFFHDMLYITDIYKKYIIK
jgi:hypothetical protein